MSRHLFTSILLLAVLTSANAYWLMGIGALLSKNSYRAQLRKVFAEDFITTERIDPIVSPGRVASHVHSGAIELAQIYLL